MKNGVMFQKWRMEKMGSSKDKLEDEIYILNEKLNLSKLNIAVLLSHLDECVESVNPDLINKKIFTKDEIETFRDNLIKELKKQGIDKTMMVD